MEKVNNIIILLKKNYKNSKTSLKYNNPLEILIATILSAQCTDERVNKVTEVLFKKFKNAKDYANSDLKVLENYIKSTGFYRNKSKNIKNACKMIVDKFNGKVPDNMDDLIKLPGVARKTANIVLSNVYGKAEGIAIDTHAKRVSYRLGLTKNKDPNKIEQDLMKIIPKKYWLNINHLFVEHGRAICKAPTPYCSKCFLDKLCPKFGVTKKY